MCIGLVLAAVFQGARWVLDELAERAHRTQGGWRGRSRWPAAARETERWHEGDAARGSRRRYLIGSARDLAPVWNAWHVSAVRDPTNGKLVTHSSVTYGVSATGRLLTLYGPSFTPAQIVHDVPQLIAR